PLQERIRRVSPCVTREFTTQFKKRAGRMKLCRWASGNASRKLRTGVQSSTYAQKPLGKEARTYRSERGSLRRLLSGMALRGFGRVLSCSAKYNGIFGIICIQR